MTLSDVLCESYIGARDTATERVCGTCGQLKPFSDFYRDGRDSDGNIRYRRDCKDCYKKHRITEQKTKTAR